MWPDRVSNLGPLNYESGALPTALRGPTRYLLSEYDMAWGIWKFQCQVSALGDIPLL